MTQEAPVGFRARLARQSTVRARVLMVVAVTGAILSAGWVVLDPSLLSEPGRLTVWLFSVSALTAAPIVTRLTRSTMAAWVLLTSAVVVPLLYLTAIGSPLALQHATWLALLPIVGDLVSSVRGLRIAVLVSTPSAAIITLLAVLGHLGPVELTAGLFVPLLVTAAACLLMSLHAHVRGQAEERLENALIDAATAHNTAIRADRLSTVSLLAAGVAHGVNNPLLALVHNVEGLKRELADPAGAPTRDQLQAIIGEFSHGLKRVRQAVDALGTFSQPAYDGEQTADVEAVLNHLVGLVRHAVDPRITLRVDVKDLGRVEGSRAEVGQLFLNVLVNAVQSIPSDGLKHRIEIVGSPVREGWISVEVRDDGAGIDSRDLAHVWEPYYTTRDVGEGAGLGLFVVGDYVRRAGGAANIQSKVGIGTTVRIVLPSVDVPKTPPRVQRRTDAHAPHRAHILLVDDEPLALRVLLRALKDKHRVTAESDPRAALERILAGEPVDLIISDIMMPGLTGDELYYRVIERRPELTGRFVFVTGATLREGQAERLARIGAPVLLKPFGMQDLLVAVNETLSGSATVRPLSP